MPASHPDHELSLSGIADSYALGQKRKDQVMGYGERSSSSHQVVLSREQELMKISPDELPGDAVRLARINIK